MSEEEVLLIDDSDDEPMFGAKGGSAGAGTSIGTDNVEQCQPDPRLVAEDVIQLDSDSDDDIKIDYIIPGDIVFEARVERRPIRRRRDQISRNRRKESNISEQMNGQNVFNDCTEDQTNGNDMSEGIKNELISPSKIKSSPNTTPIKSMTTESENSEPVVPQIPEEISSKSSVTSQSLSLNSSQTTDPVPQHSLSLQSLPQNPTESLIQTTISCCQPSAPIQTLVPNSLNSMQSKPNPVIVQTPIPSQPSIKFQTLPQTLTQLPILSSHPLITTQLFSQNLIETQINSIEPNRSNVFNSKFLDNSNQNTFETNGTEDEVTDIEDTVDIENGGFGTKQIDSESQISETESAMEEPFVYDFESSALVREKVVRKGEHYVCSDPNCKQEFNNATLHYKHEKKHLLALKSVGIKTFKCQKCLFCAFTQIELIYHNSEHNGIYLCRFQDCLFRAKSPDYLNIHMKKHRKSKRIGGLKKGQYCDCGESICSRFH